jgi:hypothetical protein
LPAPAPVAAAPLKAAKPVAKVKTVAAPASRPPQPRAVASSANHAKPVVQTKPSQGQSQTRAQVGATAPFAAQTRLRALNRPANLVGDVLEKQTDARKKLFH